MSRKFFRDRWLRKKKQFAGKLTKPDSEDLDTVNHLNWYMTTGFVLPYPGESRVRPPSDFKNPAPPVTWTTIKSTFRLQWPSPRRPGRGFLLTPQAPRPHQPEPPPA